MARGVTWWLAPPLNLLKWKPRLQKHREEARWHRQAIWVWFSTWPFHMNEGKELRLRVDLFGKLRIVPEETATKTNTIPFQVFPWKGEGNREMGKIYLSPEGPTACSAWRPQNCKMIMLTLTHQQWEGTKECKTEPCQHSRCALYCQLAGLRFKWHYTTLLADWP